MRLRICDGEFERIVPATREVLEEAFSPTTAAAPGTEITLTEAAVYMMSV